MKAKDIIAEIEASEKLLARGWKYSTCPSCRGAGCKTVDYSNAELSLPFICMTCKGEGMIWVPPITK